MKETMRRCTHVLIRFNRKMGVRQKKSVEPEEINESKIYYLLHHPNTFERLAGSLLKRAQHR